MLEAFGQLGERTPDRGAELKVEGSQFPGMSKTARVPARPEHSVREAGVVKAVHVRGAPAGWAGEAGVKDIWHDVIVAQVAHVTSSG